MIDGGSGTGPGSPSSQAGAKAPDKRSGSPADALTASLAAAFSEAKQAELWQPDVRVSVAFALGWQMAEIYRPDRDSAAQPGSEDLPGLSRLSERYWQQIGLDQVQAGITKLQKPIWDAGLEAPNAQDFASTLKSVTDEGARTQAITDFHIDLLAILTAADFRLGKAYGLGRALADTTRPPVDYRAALAPQRVGTVAAWIRALTTALPPHAAHPVADSLDAWSRWGHPGQQQQTVDVDVTVAKLEAQGRLWRSLLSGEKRPTDVLEISDYLRAGEGMLQRSSTLAGRFLKHYWWLAVLIVVLFGIGVAVVASSSSPVAVVGGAGAILGSLGLSWKGIGASLGAAAARVEQPLWQAEIDAAIYERITPQTIVDNQRAVERGPDEPSLAARR